MMMHYFSLDFFNFFCLDQPRTRKPQGLEFLLHNVAGANAATELLCKVVANAAP